MHGVRYIPKSDRLDCETEAVEIAYIPSNHFSIPDSISWDQADIYSVFY